MADGDKEMSLRYRGTCVSCGQEIPQGVKAIYNSVAKNVRHLDCSETIDRGVAGGSARREYERRLARAAAHHEARVAETKANIKTVFGEGWLAKVATLIAVDSTPPRTRQSTRAWATGATGEERVGARLDALAEIGAITLHDRRIPRSRANIDHLVVTPWGVWVVDTKHYRGKKVDFDVVGSFFGIGGRKRLLVGGRDRTQLVEGVEWQVSKVKGAISNNIDVRGCLCFVDSEWPLFLADFSVRDTYICWPKKLVQVLLRHEQPILDPEAVAQQLARAFPAA